MVSGAAHRARAGISQLRLPARARILDAGCGWGRNMIDLARHGTVTGIELSATSVALARARNSGEVIEGSVLSDAVFGRLLRAGRLARRDRAPRRRSRRLARAAPRRRARRRAARHRPRPTSGCGPATTRSTTTTAATRAPRCSPSRARPAGSPCAPPTSTHCSCPSRSRCASLDRFSRKTTESSLDLWVPPPRAQLAARTAARAPEAAP